VEDVRRCLGMPVTPPMPYPKIPPERKDPAVTIPTSTLLAMVRPNSPKEARISSKVGISSESFSEGTKLDSYSCDEAEDWEDRFLVLDLRAMSWMGDDADNDDG